MVCSSELTVQCTLEMDLGNQALLGESGQGFPEYPLCMPYLALFPGFWSPVFPPGLREELQSIPAAQLGG